MNIFDLGNLTWNYVSPERSDRINVSKGTNMHLMEAMQTVIVEIKWILSIRTKWTGLVRANDQS